MAILKTKDIRKLGKEEIEKKLKELKLELAKERANIDVGSTVLSPGKIREIRRTIARIKTIQNQGGKAK
jgi:large subunit ribosomal protein L29